MRTLHRLLWVTTLVALAGCSEWAPIRSARDLEGQQVKIEAHGKEAVVIEQVVTCDDEGYVIANQVSDCRENPAATFDTRRDKVLVHDGSAKSNVGYIVACVLAAVFVPAGIVGTAILTH